MGEAIHPKSLYRPTSSRLRRTEGIHSHVTRPDFFPENYSSFSKGIPIAFREMQGELNKVFQIDDTHLKTNMTLEDPMLIRDTSSNGCFFPLLC